jgi:hypothetical protein
MTDLLFFFFMFATFANPLTVNPPRTAMTVTSAARVVICFAATLVKILIILLAWILPWIPKILRKENGTAPNAPSATVSPL